MTLHLYFTLKISLGIFGSLALALLAQLSFQSVSEFRPRLMSTSASLLGVVIFCRYVISFNCVLHLILKYKKIYLILKIIIIGCGISEYYCTSYSV
jgi:hypothetical protein